MAIKKYRVTQGAVEINGQTYFKDAEVPSTAFRPASGNRYEDWTNVRVVDGMTIGLPTLRDEPGELESLLASGHVEEV